MGGLLRRRAGVPQEEGLCSLVPLQLKLFKTGSLQYLSPSLGLE